MAMFISVSLPQTLMVSSVKWLGDTLSLKLVVLLWLDVLRTTRIKLNWSSCWTTSISLWMLKVQSNMWAGTGYQTRNNMWLPSRTGFSDLWRDIKTLQPISLGWQVLNGAQMVISIRFESCTLPTVQCEGIMNFKVILLNLSTLGYWLWCIKSHLVSKFLLFTGS